MPTNLMRWKTMLGATLLVTVFAVAQQSDRADMMMEAAARKERVDGDLKGAIEQYRKIAAQFARQPEVAARALLQMGQCQEKLGQAEARKSYERIVREYGSAQQYASAARERLAALSGGTTPAGGMNLRRVDSGERFKYVRGVSSDGRWIAFSYSDDGGSQGLYDTVARQEKILVKLDWNGDVYGAGPALSRDGKWLAFATYRYAATDAELRVVRTDGSGMRTIHRLTGKSWVVPKDWTPDGRQVLAQISQELPDTPGRTAHLCLVNVADGAVKRLAQAPGADRHAFVSPDGSFIVYATPGRHRDDADDGQGGEIRIMAIDGSGDQTLVPDGPAARPLGWSPDGKGILLWSRKTGEPGLWFVPVTGAKATGEPQLLRAGMPSSTWPAGLTSDGRFFFVEYVRKSNSYLVQLNAGSGAPGQPARVTSRFEGMNAYATWSPDGRKLAWFGLKQSDMQAGALLHIRDLSSGREKVLAFPGASPGFTPQWLPDNRTILYARAAGQGHSLYAFDTETSESRPLAENVSNFHAVTNDGRFAYQVRGPNFDKITALDTQSKTERQIASLEGRTFTFAVSPDGRSLACVVIPKTSSRPRRLVLLDTQTGRTRDLVEPPRGITFHRRSISWTPDGASVVLRTNDGVWAFPATGGEGKLLFRSNGGALADVAVSPDGKTLSYTQSNIQHDLWVLENFLPVTNAQKK